MLTSIVTVGIVGIVVYIIVISLSFLYIHPLTKCIIISVLTGIILLLLVVNIVLGAEQECNYYILAGVGLICCVYLVTDWKFYRDWKTWF